MSAVGSRRKAVAAVSLAAIGIVIFVLASKETIPAPSTMGAGPPLVRTADPNNELKPTNIVPHNTWLTAFEKQTDIPLGQLEAFLAADENNPVTWAAVLDLCNDVDLLDRALARFPRNSDILMRAICLDGQPLDKLALYAEEFHKYFPKDSFGSYALAEVSLRKGDPSKALDLIAAGIQGRPPVILDAAIAAERRSALESLGIRPSEAGIRCFNTSYDLQSSMFLTNLAKQLLEVEGDASKTDVSSSELGVSLSEHMKMATTRNFSASIFATKLQMLFLEKLPTDYEFGATGKTIAQQLTLVRAQSEANYDLVKQLPELLSNASDQEMIRFSNNALVSGEMSAFQKLTESRKGNVP